MYLFLYFIYTSSILQQEYRDNFEKTVDAQIRLLLRKCKLIYIQGDIPTTSSSSASSNAAPLFAVNDGNRIAYLLLKSPYSQHIADMGGHYLSLFEETMEKSSSSSMSQGHLHLPMDDDTGISLNQFIPFRSAFLCFCLFDLPFLLTLLSIITLIV